MLPNYLRTYSSALSQIRAFEKAFKKQNYGQSVPKILVLNACIWLAKIYTLKIYMQYSTYFACYNDLCSAVLTNLLGDIYSSAFCHIWALKKALRRVTSAKGSQNSEYYMLSFDWPEQTDKIGCNIFNARMICAALWCQIVWEHFPQLCVKFQPWRRQLGNVFMTTPYF